MEINNKKTYARDFDYEEDDFDRYKSLGKNLKSKDVFTNKSKMKKFEFDYEEDAYEPRIWK